MDTDLVLDQDLQGVIEEDASPTATHERRETTGGMMTVPGNLGEFLHLCC